MPYPAGDSARDAHSESGRSQEIDFFDYDDNDQSEEEIQELDYNQEDESDEGGALAVVSVLQDEHASVDELREVCD